VNALEGSGELRVDGTPCAPCTSGDDISVWVTLESTCEDTIEWTTPTPCLISQVTWELPTGESGTWSPGFCQDAFADWVATPETPEEFEIARFDEIVPGGAPGEYSFVATVTISAGKDEPDVAFDGVVE
jgi:hypothetical protein